MWFAPLNSLGIFWLCRIPITSLQDVVYPSLVACFLSILPVHAQAWFTYKEALATGSPRILEYHQNSKELSKTGSQSEEKVCEKPLWDAAGLRQRLCCLAGGLDEMFASGLSCDQRPATTCALSRLKTGRQRPQELQDSLPENAVFSSLINTAPRRYAACSVCKSLSTAIYSVCLFIWARFACQDYLHAVPATSALRQAAKR